MSVVESKIELSSVELKKRYGYGWLYGEGVYARSEYGGEELLLNTTYYGRANFGFEHYGLQGRGPQVPRFGIYQIRHKQGRRIIVREKFYMPSPTVTEAKTVSQTNFRNAILGYQALTAEQKKSYHIRAYGKHFTGYNLFIIEYMKSH